MRVAVLVTLLLVTVVVPAAADDCPELVGRWPYGPAYAVAQEGIFAYFGSGTTLLIADVSDPASPEVVGNVALPGVIRGVAVSGSHVYVAAWDAGPRVIDLIDPRSPVEVGSTGAPGHTRSATVAGAYVYVADGEAGMDIFDATSCALPAPRRVTGGRLP